LFQPGRSLGVLHVTWRGSHHGKSQIFGFDLWCLIWGGGIWAMMWTPPHC
jgi:hypothetical protein